MLRQKDEKGQARPIARRHHQYIELLKGMSTKLAIKTYLAGQWFTIQAFLFNKLNGSQH